MQLATIGFVQNDLVRDLLKECAKMHELDHPNVLKLIGVCLDGGPAPYIIMPFMDNGSLLSHLKAERESIVLDPNCSNLEDIVSSMKLVIYSRNISDELIISQCFGFKQVIKSSPSPHVEHYYEEIGEYVHTSGQRNGISCK